MLRKAHTLRPE